MGKLNIDLLGTSFTIEAKEDNEYLQKLLSHFTQVTREVKLMAHNTDLKKVAILSGIMICDELLKDRMKYEELKKQLDALGKEDDESAKTQNEVERITLKMIQDIDRIVP